MATVDCLATHIIQNIFLCVRLKKQPYKGLESFESGWQGFYFGVHCPFKNAFVNESHSHKKWNMDTAY